MLHYEGKLPAPTVFKLLSIKLYKKGGCFSKILKITEKKICLVCIKDNCKLSIHAKFSLISALIPVLLNVEFLNGDFNVKFQNFVLRFLKNYSCIFFENLHNK